MIPTIKPKQATTYHRDGTVSLWDVYRQQWTRLAASDIRDEVLASLPPKERARIKSQTVSPEL